MTDAGIAELGVAELRTRAQAALEAGQPRDAIPFLQQVVARDKHADDARQALIEAYRAIGWSREALAETRAVYEGRWPSVQLRAYFAQALHADGQIAASIREYEQILAAEPQLSQLRFELARLYRVAGRYEASLEAFETLRAERPHDADLMRETGAVYQDAGQLTEALAWYRRALDVDPVHARAWQGIALLQKDGLSPDECAALEQHQQNEAVPPDDRARLGFALGKSYERRGDVQHAAEQYELANRLQRALFEYDVERDLDDFDKIAELFDKAFFERRADAGLPDCRPVFIVGMPRSGTTLVEQILASHSQVHGAGELNLVYDALRSVLHFGGLDDYAVALGNASREDLRTVAQHYLDGIAALAGEHVVNKMPANFMHVGIISVLFPAATIIHCRRDPLDTCFSIYKQFFANGHLYSYDLEELGKYYRGYTELMTHWRSVLPGRMHELQYESLVSDTETEARRLVDACGLEWQDACLDFHRVERPVATLSAGQVRRPIYSESVGAWQNFEQMLQPLLQHL